jgi:hypothetical protein
MPLRERIPPAHGFVAMLAGAAYHLTFAPRARGEGLETSKVEGTLVLPHLNQPSRLHPEAFDKLMRR